MEPFVRYIFQRQIADQCELALRGVAMMRAELASNAPIRVDLWQGIQIFAMASGNVSKALWGSTAKSAEGRADLRASLGVSDESVLKERTVRNHLEHFDERIDKWAKADNRGNFMDQHIGAPESVDGLDRTERFRVYDPDAGVVYFWGAQIEVEPVVHELARVLGAAERALRSPDWFKES